LEEKTTDSILKILLIIAILLSILSIIIPWGNLSVGIIGNVDFYCWGISGTSIFGGSESTTELYVTLFFNDDFMTLLTENEDFIGFIIPMVLSILILPFLAIGIIYGSSYVLFDSKKDNVNIRDSALWIIVSLVFYYLFIQFGMLSLIENIVSISIANLFSYTVGYFVVIFSAIILISLYFLHKEFLESQMSEKKTKDHQKDLSRILKERYIKGEITKKEFDRMKKDIE
jgi:uncharacterized membrane protein